ncbi:MAG: hypothetical protein GX825_01640, partial [Syntrophomonadaceae bacterium]|nr:hypothetical protein [Syntrophomonadaceae bacterium]
RSYYFSWDGDNDISLSSIKSRLQSYFSDAGNKYFVDDGIKMTIGLSGNEDELIYTIKLDFDNARYYHDLTEISQTRLTSFLNAVKSRTNTEIDNTYYEGANITGKLIDNDISRYYVSYNGRSYYFSWN